MQTDTIGRECYRRKEGVYTYKDAVVIPPLWMIDDCVTFALCGPKAIKMNSMINTKLAMKKLQLSESKCCNIHVGSQQKCSCDLKVGETKMKNDTSFKYLGDHISSTLNNKNFLEVKNWVQPKLRI